MKVSWHCNNFAWRFGPDECSSPIVHGPKFATGLRACGTLGRGVGQGVRRGELAHTSWVAVSREGRCCRPSWVLHLCRAGGVVMTPTSSSQGQLLEQNQAFKDDCISIQQLRGWLLPVETGFRRHLCFSSTVVDLKSGVGIAQPEKKFISCTRYCNWDQFRAFPFTLAVIICVFLRNQANSFVKLRSSSALEWLSSAAVIHPDPGIDSMHLISSRLHFL